MKPKIGIVVPTLGRRPEYLEECLKSIRAAGKAHILVVTPKTYDARPLLSAGLADQLATDPGAGLPEAINFGFSQLPDYVEFMNWLGDDDRLTEGALRSACKALENTAGAVMVFGSCEYIDRAGQVFWTNESGPWAVPLMRFGPDLVPQPGALFKRSAFFEVGMLNSQYNWAFDFDLFIALSKVGKLKFVRKTLSQFRWHPESLSVEFRKKSVFEASQVRLAHIPKVLRPISRIWELVVRQATLFAGQRMTNLASKKARQK